MPQNILVTALNWGIGHATRCIPVINELLKQGNNVFLASDGDALNVLGNQYPSLPQFELPSYDIHYKGRSFIFNLARQVPKILSAIEKEKSAVATLIKENNIDVILSDNRYGCHSKETFNVFIGHQMNLLTGIIGVQQIVDRYNSNWLKKFHTVWIPDYSDENNLSGSLSRPIQHKLTHYIGPLTRIGKNESAVKEYDILALLSGPEPERSNLFEELKNELQKINKKAWIVKGSVGERDLDSQQGSLRISGFLNGDEVERAMNSSEYFISRSGYSTLMDLTQIPLKCLFIPTPGQTEQEYLAKYHFEKGNALTQKQGRIKLKEIFNDSTEWPVFNSKGGKFTPLSSLIAEIKKVPE